MDLLIIILFLLVFIGLGFFFSRSNRTSSDYFKGDGSIPWVVAMLSIVATETSVLTFAGIPGIAYRGDVGATRSTPVEKLYDYLLESGAKINCHDPYVNYWDENKNQC